MQTSFYSIFKWWMVFVSLLVRQSSCYTIKPTLQFTKKSLLKSFTPLAPLSASRHEVNWFENSRTRSNNYGTSIFAPNFMIRTALRAQGNNRIREKDQNVKIDTDVKVDVSKNVKTLQKPSLKEELESDWRLILHDDDFHDFEDVIDALVACVPLCPYERAVKVTYCVHETGLATVARGCKKLMDEYAEALQQSELTVSVCPEDDFESEEGDELGL